MLTLSAVRTATTIVTTRNSRYDITEHAEHFGLAGAVTVECIFGTFAGESWTVDKGDVSFDNGRLIVRNHLATSDVIAVDGIPSTGLTARF